jgi:hypothetical protein
LIKIQTLLVSGESAEPFNLRGALAPALEAYLAAELQALQAEAIRLIRTVYD